MYGMKKNGKKKAGTKKAKSPYPTRSKARKMMKKGY
tara:strand:+ start:390 stop:497 length:108 start_codon:yes stop_codon:yes gene_type:complete